jgi:hypothetical protein
MQNIQKRRSFQKCEIAWKDDRVDQIENNAGNIEFLNDSFLAATDWVMKEGRSLIP